MIFLCTPFFGMKILLSRGVFGPLLKSCWTAREVIDLIVLLVKWSIQKGYRGFLRQFLEMLL